MNNPTKYCPQCAQRKPATLDYFHRDVSRGDGLRSRCKACINAKGKEKKRLYSKEKWSKWYAANKERKNETDRKWQAENRSRKLAKEREWYQRNKGRKKDSTDRYRRERPEIDRAAKARRRSRQRDLPNTLTAHQWQRALDYFGGCCAYCDRPAGLFHTMAIEHFVPLSNPDCPGTTALNCVPACHGQLGCNNQKHTSPAAAWLESKFGPKKATQILARINAYFAWVSTQDA